MVFTFETAIFIAIFKGELERNRRSPCSDEAMSASENVCKKILDATSLSECRVALNPLPFYETCRYDYCAEEDGDAAVCDAAEEYARQCGRMGVKLGNQGWRRPDFCRESLVLHLYV
jgi:hypothetical protein